MTIKKEYIALVAIIMCVLLIANADYSQPSIIKIKPQNEHTENSVEYVEFNTQATKPTLKRSDLELPDKVYTFEYPSDTLTFNGIYLEKEILYYINIELVTPHNCSKMRITIWDPDIPPDQKQFNIFESEMFYNPDYGRSFEIPFGTEKSGGYTIEFYSESNINFNMHIKIEEGPKCLHDKIDSQYHDYEVFFEVTSFDNGKTNSHDVELDSDISYKFYIGRVSAISIVESNTVYLDYSIEDPDGTIFTIYSNELLVDISGVTYFSFGTAQEGKYKISLRIYCDVAWVNIAYVIVEDYDISDIVDVNKTIAPAESDSDEVDVIEELEKTKVSLPIEGLITILAFTGCMSGVVYVLIIKQKKEGNMGLPFSRKHKD